MGRARSSFRGLRRMFIMQNRPSRETSGAPEAPSDDQFTSDVEEFRILDQCLCLLQLGGRIDCHPCDGGESWISLQGLHGKGT